VLSIACGLCIKGCGDSSEGCAVSGTVTWKGAPIRDGYVNFMPVDGRNPAESGMIQEGRFELCAYPSKCRVEVYATNEGEYNQTMNQVLLVQYIPDQFNHQSDLFLEFEREGLNSYDFALTGNEP
jgi:hypothetical protein